MTTCNVAPAAPTLPTTSSETGARHPAPRRRIVITSYSGELGGMEMRMAQEARVLRGAGYGCLLATRRFNGYEQWASAARSDGVEVTVFDPPPIFEQWRWRRINRLRALLFSMRQLRRYRADLVHVALCWTTYGLSALWLARRCALPTVLSVHNAFPRDEISAWHAPLLVDAFASVRGVYAVSASALAYFLAQFASHIAPGTRLCVIPNSVDTDRFIPSQTRRVATRARFGIPEKALVIGAVARLSPQKRPQALIRMLCALRREFDQLVLVLVGTGPMEQALREQVALAGVQAQVIFAGFQDGVEHIIPAFDLHLLLSRNEGFGISTIEAMACGVPAVGTDVPGTADVLRGSKGGLLVPLEDEAAACALVGALLRDPARRACMAQHARAEAHSTYARPIIERKIRQFYEGLLE